jgi:hypothetical protein
VKCEPEKMEDMRPGYNCKETDGEDSQFPDWKLSRDLQCTRTSFNCSANFGALDLRKIKRQRQIKEQKDNNLNFHGLTV